MNPPRFEPQGSYFDQYPDRRTRLNSYAAPIPTRSETTSELTITTPRRASLSSRGPVNLIHASELSRTPFAYRFSSPPQAPPADLALLQRARRGSANGASSFSDPSASPLSLASLERPKSPTTSRSEASIYRTVTSESSRRRSSSFPHIIRPIDHDSKQLQSASSEKRLPSPSRSINEGVHDLTKASPKNGVPTTTSASTLHHFKRIDRVPLPSFSGKPNKVRRTEAIEPDAMPPPAQAPLTFLVHPDRQKANRPVGVNYLLSVPKTPRSGSTTSFSNSQEGTVKTERGDDQHSVTSSTSTSSRRFSLNGPGSRIGKLFSLRPTSSHSSSPTGITSNTSISDVLPPIQPGRKSSTSLRGLSTRGLGTTGVHSGSPKSAMIDLFAGPGVYDPLQGVYRSSSTASSMTGSPLHPKPSQYPGLPVPPDEFEGRGTSTRSVSAPPDLDALIASMNGRVIGGSRGGACSSRKKHRSLVRVGKGSAVEASARVGDDGRSRGEIERREPIPDIPTPPELERRSAQIDRDRTPRRQVSDPIPEGPIFGGVVRPSPLPRVPSARSSQGSSRTSSPRRERYSFVAPMDKSAPVEREEVDPNEAKLDFPVISSDRVEDVTTSTSASEPSAPDATKSFAEQAPKRATPILSIDEIVRQHAGVSYLSKLAASVTASVTASVEQSKEGPTSDEISSPATTQVGPSNDGELKSGLSMSLSLAHQLESGDTDEIFLDMSKLSTLSASDDTRSILSTKSFHGPQALPRARVRKLSNPTFPSSSSLRIEWDLAHVLRSAQLTRLITLQRPPNLGLIISYADVGNPQGHPVLIHLGLGCVRHIIALYDELARAYNLRLICVDRWGLGRSSEVPDSKRGFGAWALVMEEVVDSLGLERFSILAHSAGGSFAIASALSPASSSKVKGSLHLLAPWILSTSSSTSNSTSNIDPLSGPYKLLKYVPSGLLKTAQLAEWKLTARKLGKPPTVQHAAIGYDAREGKVRWVGGRGEGRMVEDNEEEGQDGVGVVQAEDLTNRSPTLSGARPRKTSTFSLKTRSFGPTAASPPPPLYDESHPRDPNTSSDPKSFHPLSTPLIPPTLSGPSLTQGLLRASHAESLRGSTADLALLLGNRSSKAQPERTERVPDPMNLAPGMKVKIWLGEKDERISLGSVRGLQERLGEGRCKVRVVEGADHGLITNAKVIGEVFESIAEEWIVTSSRGTGT